MRKLTSARFYQGFWTSLDWLFPPRCGGCGGEGDRWCANCQQDVLLLVGQICPVCGRMQSTAELCRRCQATPPTFQAARSWAYFEGPLRRALHRLKYNRDLALAICFSYQLAGLVGKNGWKVDLLSPVPLGVARREERGYNQASLLARPLALEMGSPYKPSALRKIRETSSQVGLSVRERWNNVQGAFEAKSVIVRGKSILVIDDVFTSGATLEACSQALLKAGADRVYALTLARTSEHPAPSHPAG